MWLSVMKSRSSGGLLGVHGFRQSGLLGYLPAAAFAKFDRSKPHLNVGTIGNHTFLFYI